MPYKSRENEKKKCPKCGRTYRGFSARSRVVNGLKICPDCGTREALEAFSKYKREHPDEED